MKNISNTPSLEDLLTQDLQAWLAAKEAIQRAMSRSGPAPR